MKKKIFVICGFILALFLLRSIKLENKIFFSGEFLFSYDYLGHAYGLLKEKILDPGSIKFVSQCPGCPAFYHISSWYMYWVMSLLAVGQILGIHPFVYYQTINFLSQAVSLYIFNKLIVKKFNKFACFVSILFFIYLPHKIFLMPSATLDGVIYSILIVTITLYVYFLQNITKFTLKNLLRVAVSQGFFLGLFLNIAVAHFPLIIIALATISLAYISRILKNLRSSMIYVVLTGFIALLLNTPMILSQLTTGDAHYITDFNVLTPIDSFTAGFFTAGVNPFDVKTIFLIIFILVLVSNLRFKQKTILLTLYMVVAFFLTGFKINSIFLYQYIFDYFPFMNHMRGLYRFIFFQELVIYIFVYTGLSRLVTSKNNFSKLTALVLSVVLLLLTFNYIKFRNNLFHTSNLPSEYFQAAQYMDNLVGSKIYFPPYWSDTGPSMSGNYSWLPDKKVFNTTLYTNPFTSLFRVPGMLNIEGQYPTVYQQQLRSLVDLDRSPSEIISSLEYLGIKYLVLDENYFWSTNFPKVNLIDLKANLIKLGMYGNITIYELKPKTGECISSFGNFMPGYCNDVDKPAVLIDRSSTDLLLDRLSQTGKQFRLSFNKLSHAPNFIVNVATRTEVQKNGILIPPTINQFDSNKSNIYSQTVTPGSYVIYTPYLRLSAADRIFKDEKIYLSLGDQVIDSITPYSSAKNFSWHLTNFVATSPETISISVTGHGSVVLGKPLLIPQSVWQELIKDQQYNIPTVTTQGYTTEVDVLDSQNTKFSSFQPYEQVDYSPTYISKSNLASIETSLNVSKTINRLTIITSTAFLEDASDGVVLITDEQNKEVGRVSISKPGIPLLTTEVQLTRPVNHTINIKLMFYKQAALISRFVVKIPITKQF